jgi:hypothetical protein
VRTLTSTGLLQAKQTDEISVGEDVENGGVKWNSQFGK